MFFFVWSILSAIHCNNKSDFDIVPFIEYLSISTNQLHQIGTERDTLRIVLRFEDGDGDLGDRSNAQDIEIIDSRTGIALPNSSIPMVPILGSENGISGELTIRLTFIPGIDMCCILPNGRQCETLAGFAQDTLQYLLRIRDRAGNWSNQVSTDMIFVQCE